MVTMKNMMNKEIKYGLTSKAMKFRPIKMEILPVMTKSEILFKKTMKLKLT